MKEFNLPIGTLQFSDDECKEGTIEIITSDYLDKKMKIIINRLPELLSISNKEKSLIAIADCHPKRPSVPCSAVSV